MKVETKEEFLRFTDSILIDKSIQEIRWIDYDTRGADPNKGGLISLKMLDTNPIALLEQSYLVLEFDIKKADGTRYADAGIISLTNNGIMFAFDNVQLSPTNIFPGLFIYLFAC